MRNFLVLLFFFTFNVMISQEVVGMKEVYIDNDLVYKSSNDELLTGFAQRKRKNGHLVYEEVYENGIILCSNLYYNGKEIRVSNKSIYNPNKPFVLIKAYSYDIEGNILEITTYDDDGIKILHEQFINGNISYSCQYLGKKKNGLELGYRHGGEKMTFRCEYINGKKNGTEYCLNDNGIETRKEFKNGKRIN